MIYLFSGSRYFDDYDLFQKYLNEKGITLTPTDRVVVGDAKGLDSMVKRYCTTYAIPHQVFTADWNRYGNAAGPIRNQAMVDSIVNEPMQSIRGLFFISPSSKGTVHCYNIFKKQFTDQNCLVFEVNDCHDGKKGNDVNK